MLVYRTTRSRPTVACCELRTRLPRIIYDAADLPSDVTQSRVRFASQATTLLVRHQQDELCGLLVHAAYNLRVSFSSQSRTARPSYVLSRTHRSYMYVLLQSFGSTQTGTCLSVSRRMRVRHGSLRPTIRVPSIRAFSDPGRRTEKGRFLLMPVFQRQVSSVTHVTQRNTRT